MSSHQSIPSGRQCGMKACHVFSMTRRKCAICAKRDHLLSTYWLDQSRLVINKPHPDNPISLLEHYINTCVKVANAPRNDDAKPDFDVYAHLPTLVEGIMLLKAGAGTSAQQSLLITLAAGWPVKPQNFDGVESWLNRLALNALWQTQGISAVLALIPLYIRPFLLYYLHEKFGLNTEQRNTLANALESEGAYVYAGDHDEVIEQLREETSK